MTSPPTSPRWRTRTFSIWPVVRYPYEPFAERVWELRPTVTPYDAWYVALAESLNARLATLDLRLSRAPGPRCGFVLPPDRGRAPDPAT